MVSNIELIRNKIAHGGYYYYYWCNATDLISIEAEVITRSTSRQTIKDEKFKDNIIKLKIKQHTCVLGGAVWP